MPIVNFRKLKPGLFLRARAIEGDKPKAPKEFLIFKPGDNLGDDGSAIFNLDAARKIEKIYRMRGVKRLVIDYDHYSIKEGVRPEDRKAAGWFTPEVRIDDKGDPWLWMSNINWTDAAKNGIENKEWLYISPVFSKDENLQISSIVNVAITNNPATWGARPLIAASRGLSMDPNLAMLYACLLAVAGGADQAFAQWAGEKANEMLAMAGDNAAAIQEGAKQYMVSDAVAASVKPEEMTAASATTDDKQVAASATMSEDEKAARSLNYESAALLARSQMAAASTDAAVTRSAEIEKLQKEKLLPKDGATVIFARSCGEEEFAKFAANLRASSATIRSAGVKAPVGGKNVAAGKNPVSTEIDPIVLRSAVRQSGIPADKLTARILANREKQAAKETK